MEREIELTVPNGYRKYVKEILRDVVERLMDHEIPATIRSKRKFFVTEFVIDYIVSTKLQEAYADALQIKFEVFVGEMQK